jgi:hypothetical protein
MSSNQERRASEKDGSGKSDSGKDLKKCLCGDTKKKCYGELTKECEKFTEGE